MPYNFWRSTLRSTLRSRLSASLWRNASATAKSASPKQAKTQKIQASAAPTPRKQYPFPAIPSWALFTLNCFLIAHLTFEHIFTVRSTVGPSMLPTLRVRGDCVFISRLHRRGRWIKVGDLISYYSPMKKSVCGIKRVVAMPGDFVLRDTPGAEGEGWMIQVPEGHCYVTGDNLPASRDSRMFGPLPLALIRGRVMAKVWPSVVLFNDDLRPVQGLQFL